MAARPSPPRSFRGPFLTAPPDLSRWSAASGPFSLQPRAAALPRDTEDLQRLVRWAHDAGEVLIPRGAGTGMPGGNVGRGVVVDLSRSFTGLGEVDLDARRIRAGCGIVAGAVETAAREKGLFFPPLPSSWERATIGGMVANNAAGARSFRYGAVRAWIEELDVVLADGEAVRLRRGEGGPERFSDLLEALSPQWPRLEASWPRVRKNSSGYALDRFLPGGEAVDLLVGSEGTLAFVTSATLRLETAPERRGLVLLAVSGPDELLGGIAAAGEANASACEFLGRPFLELAGLERHPELGSLVHGAWALLLVEVEGAEEEVRRGVETLRSATRTAGDGFREAFGVADAERLWAVRHAASPTIAREAERGMVSMQFIEDGVVPVERLPDYLHGLDRILAEHETRAIVFGHAGDGHVHVNPLIDVRRGGWRERVDGILRGTVSLVAELGGTLAGEHGDGRVRAPFLSDIWSAGAVEAFERVKAGLDPHGILNPGVILPLPGQDPLEGIGPPALLPKADAGAPD